MIKQYIKFSSFSKYDNLRMGAFYKLPKTKFDYISFWSVIEQPESGSRPAGGISEDDYGEAISLGGEQIGADGFLNLSKIPYVSFDFFDNAKKGKVNNHDILLCKDGALTGKVCIANTNDVDNSKIMVNEHVYIIRANDNYYRQDMLFYIMALPLFRKQVIDLAFRKKGQPGLNLDHLKKIKIPSIPLNIQDMILAEIGPTVARIETIRKTKKSISELINTIMADEIGIDLDDFLSIDNSQKQFISLSEILKKNNSVRLSYRWNKSKSIQEQLCHSSKYTVEPLGKHIVDIKNGWSPTCEDLSTTYRVFSLDAISFGGIISFDATKFSDEVRNNFNDFVSKENDFFISRGNTVDLVALASIVECLDENIDTIFPDLMIRIKFDDAIDIHYMVYIFNSFIGRLYFKYAAKGKNQTMVKVSRAEINDFFVPLPDIKKQREIAENIKSKIAEQDKFVQEENAMRRRLFEYINSEIVVKK